MAKSGYSKSVFINCPFDSGYQDLFDAIVFTVQDCGFVARCAKEVQDSGEVRIEKITSLIRECRYGVHDISRTELDRGTNLPRFNMPLELGLFLGAKSFGGKKQRKKLSLVLDTEQYRYQQFCSDIAGQDISAHGGDPEQAITLVRDWLSDSTEEMIPSGSMIVPRFRQFREDLPLYCGAYQLDEAQLTFVDFRNMVYFWLKENGWPDSPSVPLNSGEQSDV